MSAIIALLFIAACIWNFRHVVRTYRIQQLPKGCLVSRAPAARESRSTTFNPRAWHDAPAPVAYDMLAAYAPKHL